MAQTRLEVAQEMLRAAGELIVKHLLESVPAREVESGHEEAPIDLIVDRLLIDRIRAEFPEDRILTEESRNIGGDGDYLWVVDPVDGTNNLRLKVPHIATCIAVQRSGETIAGAVYHPVLDEMFVAEKGSGAFLNGKRIWVSERTEPSVGYYVQGYRVPPAVQIEILRVLIPEARRVLRTWSPSLDWCSLARGHAEFLVAYDTETEDLIQGRLILEEAGGKVTTWDGHSVRADLHTRRRVTLVASNAAVHDHLRARLSCISLATCLRGAWSQLEEQAIKATSASLRAKSRTLSGEVAERIDSELNLPRSAWEQNSDLHYLVTRAEALQRDPYTYLRELFDGFAPHLSGEPARHVLLDTLRSVADAWEPGRTTSEVAAQALEVAAHDVLLHDRMQSTGISPSVIEDLARTLPEDSFAVGARLKSNAFRQVRALESQHDDAGLDPVRRLADLPFPDPPERHGARDAHDGFAALIITAGRGTRLRSSVPKGLIPLATRPLIDYTIEALRTAGAMGIVVVVGYKEPLHRAYLGPDYPLTIQAQQLGTAHAVMAARAYFEGYQGPLLVCYSDMPFIESRTLLSLVDRHRSCDADMTLLTTDRANHPEFGRVIRREGKVSHISQVRFDSQESDEVDGGFYCFRAPDFWDHIGQIRNANNRREFVLTEIVRHMTESNKDVVTLYTADPIQTMGINRPSELIEAERILYVRSKMSWADPCDHAARNERCWKLRFYESYGGVRLSGIDGDRDFLQQFIDSVDPEFSD